MPTSTFIPLLEASTLRQWLEEKRPLQVLDVRPLDQREEWLIPGSIHVDAYEKLKANDPEALAGVSLQKDIPVVTVCAGGKVSQLAAAQLLEKGYQVYSLEGGMKAWSTAWNVATLKLNEEAAVLQIRRTGKGCLSYLVGSAGEALVIDPSVEPEVYVSLARQRGWQIKYVLETHLHADHLSRARPLADLVGASLLLPQNTHLQFPYQAITSQTILMLGSVSLQAIATPGHTLESFSYQLADRFLFSGDTLFTNGIGRPDLKASEEESRNKTRLLYQSLQKLLTLPDDTVVLPGHTSQPVAFNEQPIATTLGELKEKLSWLALPEESFIETVLQRIPPTPSNYLSISDLNRKGDFSWVDPLELEAGANRCAIS